MIPFFKRCLFVTAVLVIWACGTSRPPEDVSAAALLERTATPEQAVDVVVITIDTLRADATGFSGAGKVVTPVWDRLASQGVHFPFAHAHAVTTLPSHSSIFTGLLPYQHGVRDNAGFVLEPHFPTMATLLKQAGYQTAAFISAFPLDARYGLNQGFDTYDDQYQGFGKRDFVFAERPGAVTVERAKAWYDAHAGQKRFLWIHLFTPHFPYEPMEPFATQYRDQPYYGEAATTDFLLKPFLEPFLDGQAPPSLIIFTSDHGEGLGEHGELTHGFFAYETTLQVPLVLWAPGLINHGVSQIAARHIDLLPTTLHLLGLEAPANLPGRSLFAPPKPEQDQGTYFEALMCHLNQGWAPLVGRIDHRGKAIHLPKPEFYDLSRDPHELNNLVVKEARRFEATLAPLPENVGVVLNRRALDPEEMETLQSLGYAASNPSQSAADIDPKDMIQADTNLKKALNFHHHGKTMAAIRLLDRITREYPSFEPAYRDLTYILQSRGENQAAAAIMRRAWENGLRNEAMARRLALALSQAGKHSEAHGVLNAWSASRDPDTHRAIGKVLTGLGQYPRAEASFRRALELDATNPDANVDLGILYLGMERLPEAKTQFQTALAQDTTNPLAWNGLGIVLARQGDAGSAGNAFERALTHDPEFVDGHLNLARILISLGKEAEARVVLERCKTIAGGPKLKTVENLLARLKNP